MPHTAGMTCSFGRLRSAVNGKSSALVRTVAGVGERRLLRVQKVTVNQARGSVAPVERVVLAFNDVGARPVFHARPLARM